MIHYSAAVDRKAQRILKDKKFINDCLEAGICPKCGTLLTQIRVKEGYHIRNYIKCGSSKICGYTKELSITIS